MGMSASQNKALTPTASANGHPAGLAICYVTDGSYALPTLISASNARKHLGEFPADIFIITFAINEADFAELTKHAAARSITVLTFPKNVMEQFDQKRFENSYISIAAMGRFFIADALPSEYQTILYIDGDTFITEQISAIGSAIPPDGFLGVVEDPLVSFARRDFGSYGRWVRQYYSSLGLSLGDRYFNSGVLIGSSATWRDIGAQALSYYLENTSICIHPDQSALNAVAMGRKAFISPKWNFTTQHMNYGMEHIAKPAIYHFTGSVKPWMGVFEPWTQIAPLYKAELNKVCEVHLSLNEGSPDAVAAASAFGRRFRFAMQTWKRPRLVARRRAIMKQVNANSFQ
jgi:lipopolysaccharide biosynthesis glycosyltransferase